MPDAAAALDFPETGSAQTRWILSRRGPRHPADSELPSAFLSEREPDAAGNIIPVSTIFLTNRECPWKCLMCDLWKHTSTRTVPPGAIPRQIASALGQLPPARALKLYNSGSFFDPAAIPPAEWPRIVELCQPFDHLIIECHPKLAGRRVLDFREMLGPSLEVAMGLETACPAALERLNKRITVDDFTRAAAFLKGRGIGVRTFLLVNPPFIPPEAQFDWLARSVETAFEAGADVVSLIPTRAGNGALDALAAGGWFQEPALADLERGFDFALGLGRGRVFADTWDIERFSRCGACFESRRDRLERMNLAQRSEPRAACEACHE